MSGDDGCLYTIKRIRYVLLHQKQMQVAIMVGAFKTHVLNGICVYTKRGQGKTKIANNFVVTFTDGHLREIS